MSSCKLVGAAVVLMTMTGCDSKSTSGSVAASATATTTATTAGSGPVGRYELDSSAYVNAMAETWKGRFDATQIESMKKDMKASGWIELKAGGAARTSLTTSMGGPETAINSEGTWTRNGETIHIAPSTADQATPLDCVLDGDALACSTGKVQLLYERK